MIRSSRSKVSLVLSLALLVSLLSAFLQGHIAYAAGVASSSSNSYKGIRGTAVKVAPSPRNTLSSQSTLATAKVPQVRSTPFASSNHFSPNTLGVPVVNFNGISSSDSINVNGFGVEPPDQGLCVSNGFVIELVNSAATIYDHKGNKVNGPISLNSFFGEPSTEIVFDPRCYFDNNADVWFATLTALTLKPPTSHIDLLVNHSDDPTPASWKPYSFDTTDKKAQGCPCFDDQPALSVDQNNLYLDINQFRIPEATFVTDQIYAFSKSQLLASASTINFALFTKLTIAGKPVFNIQPAISTENPNAEYFLSSFVLQSPTKVLGSSTQLAVWALTNGQAVTTGGTPTLSSVVITVQTYGQPPNASMPNGSFLDTGLDRMQQVQFINGELWGALETGIVFPGDNTIYAGIAWFIIDPTLSSDGTVIQSATVRDQNIFGVPGNYLFYPSIEANSSGAAVMIMTMSGANISPSAVYFTRPAMSQGQFDLTINIAAKGQNSYNCGLPKGSTCRWGDYSAAVLDPLTKGTTVWMATEYVPDTGSEVPNWGTRVVEVQMS